VRQPPAVFVADVEDGERPRLGEEEPSLRLEVRLEVAVEVEMVVAEVREDEHGEADPVQAMQDGRMRRGLHRTRAIARVEHLAEQPLQVYRLRCRPHDSPPLTADARLDRSQQARASTGRREDREEEEARGRLAARARDTDDLELAGRLAEEDVCRRRHGGAGARDDDLRHGQAELTLHDDRRRSGLDRRAGEVVSVGVLARNREEEGAGSDRTSVVREIPYLDRRAPEHLRRLERCDEALQVHP